MNASNHYQALADIRRGAELYGLPLDDIKPCVAIHLACSADDYPLARALRIERSIIQIRMVYIAAELCRLGIPQDKAEHILTTWNSRSNAGVTKKPGISRVKGVIRQVYRKEGGYNYFCLPNDKRDYDTDLVIEEACIGLDNCWWFQDNRLDEGKELWRYDIQFETKGWHHVLSAGGVLVYREIRNLEKDHGKKPFSKIFASHEQIGFRTGLTRQTVSDNLKRMNNLGIIKYTEGRRRKGSVKASEIQRVKPIPSPDMNDQRVRSKIIDFRELQEKHGQLTRSSK